MLRVLSDLNTTFRVSVPIDATDDASYAQGIWLTGDGQLPDAATDYPVGPIFDMGDATNGLSPDATLVAGVGSTIKATKGGSGTVTLIGGKFRGVTDQFATGDWASIGTGSSFTIGTDGKLDLIATVGGAEVVVAKCVTKHTSYEHRGTVYNQVVEFITI